jgi:hypothetical protein
MLGVSTESEAAVSAEPPFCAIVTAATQSSDAAETAFHTAELSLPRKYAEADFTLLLLSLIFIT